MEKRTKRRRRLWLAFGTVLAAAAFTWVTNLDVLNSAEGRVYTDPAKLPAHQVALVLGTSPKTSQGTPNLFFERRIHAATELYRSGRVKKLLVSGDNGTPYYDEPTAMKKALVKRGVPAKDIALDYAGFRTLDSVIRANVIFGLKDCVIVTDDFHLPRALFVARKQGMDADGFQTAPLPRSISPWTYTREIAARTMMWFDVRVLNRQPKFLGYTESI